MTKKLSSAHAGLAVWALIALSGCALTPLKPPECEGPWVPVNTHVSLTPSAATMNDATLPRPIPPGTP